MLYIFITVSSFSFQISGATILLLWSLKKCDKRIKENCINNGSNWIEFDDSGKSHTTLSKTSLQHNAKVVYLNIAAFIDIILGYACAVFSEDVNICKGLIFLLVIAFTAIIIALEKLLVNIIAKAKYSSDEQYELNEEK